MIATSDPHFEEDTLQRLLEETLPQEEANQIQSHLDHCEDCQERLCRIAGASPWWDETIDSLTLPSETVASTVEDESVSSRGEQTDNSFAPLTWLQPILRTSDSGRMGQIDQYPVDGIVGQGGMGVVLLGTDPALNRPVAIKVLAPHLASVGAARQRFMREAQAAAMIVHPSVVPIYSIVTEATLPYLVMPAIEGGNLQEQLDREGPLELSEALRIALQIAEALRAAHSQGVIHRDVKPANVLVQASNGRVLLSDFGLARALDDATLTASGIVTGTPQYMSPEQARGEAIDPRSDLFSLGSLLYALTTGRAPFRAETPLAVLRKICDSSPKPVHEINERMPPWVDRLIGGLMHTETSKRIQTAEDSVELLRKSYLHVTEPSKYELPSSISARSLGQQLNIVLVVALSLILGLAAWFWTGRPRSTPHRNQFVAPTEPATPSWFDAEFQMELDSIRNTIERIGRTADAFPQDSTNLLQSKE